MKRRRPGHGILAALALCVALTTAATGSAQARWTFGAFEAEPRDLLRAADLVLAAAREDHATVLSAETGAVVLFHDATYTFDATGRVVFRRHWVYRVLQASSVEEWSSLELRWSPWHQSLPTIEARVIGEDGRERRLQASDVEEKAERRGRPDARPAGRADPDRRRWLLAHLPDVTEGSLVEVVTEVRDLGPAFDAGVALRHYFVMFVPVLESRFTLDISKRLPLRYLVRRPPETSQNLQQTLEQTSEQTADRFRLHLRATNQPAAGESPEGLPGHVPRYPHVTFSTGRDWQSVAARYGHLVERVLHPDLAALDAEFGARLDEAALAGSARARLASGLAAVRARVSHDGSELEASPPGPRRLSEILADDSGNAVDLAAITLAALQRLGIKAHAALLDAGFGIDAEAGLPGLGLFNHVVVRVPAQTVAGEELPALWLDPGAPFARAGELPLVDQGRFALVATRDATELVALPVSTPEDNLALDEREVFLREWGAADLTESSRYAGSAEQTQRAVTAGLDDDARRRGYLAYARAFHGAQGLGRIQESEAHNLAEPFRLRLEIQGAAGAVTELDRARVRIPVAELGRRLPQVFRAPLAEPRRQEFLFLEPFATEWTYLIHPPSGFTAGNLPADDETELGPGLYRHRFRVVRDEATGAELIQGSLRFTVGQRRLTADQFERMHAAARRLLERPPLEIEMVPVSETVDDPMDQARHLVAWVAREPAGAAHRVRLVPALLALGLVDEARDQARAAMDLAPGWPLGPWALGLALAHDDLGRFAAPGADLETAREQLRAARRLAPENPKVTETLARLDLAETGVPETTQQASPAVPEEPQPARLLPQDLHPDDPKTPFYRLLAAVTGADTLTEPGLAALHPRERLRLRRDGLEGYLSLLRQVTRPEAIDIDGAPHLGYRLDLGSTGGRGRLFLTPVGSELLVAALDTEPAALGREALYRLWQGDLTGARRWLDWALEEVKRSGNDLAFRHLWPPRDEEKLTAEEVRLASAALAAPADLDGHGLDWLRAAVDRGEGIAPIGVGYSKSQANERRRAAQQALVEALLASGNERDAAARLQALLTETDRPDEHLQELEMKLRIELGDWQGVDKLVESSDDAERPVDQQSAAALRARAALLAARGEHGEAADLWHLLHDRGELLDEDALRWTAMLLLPRVAAASPDLNALNDYGRRAADPRLLRRVAALLADSGRGTEAHPLLLRAAGSGAYQLTPADLWVKARIAEDIGMIDAARRTYAELVAATSGPAEQADEDDVLFRHLAQARLSRLSFG